MPGHNLPLSWLVDTLQQQVNGLLESSQDHGASDAGWAFHMAYVRLLPVLDLLKRQHKRDQDQLTHEKIEDEVSK
jgi:hypothetical protein